MQNGELDLAGPVVESVEKYEFDYEPIQGYPELKWRGKRPFRSTEYYPAQLKETHGESVEGWFNRIYWGDNLQVMSHLLKEFRGKVKLIYIDPPFDSKADYKKTIKLKGHEVDNDYTAFEEKQYTDIWTNDEYLQYMYERLMLMRELLADDGSIYVHCDWHKGQYIRCILDEIYGRDNFINEIIWRRKGGSALSNMSRMSTSTDTIFLYSKSSSPIFNIVYMEPDPEYVDNMFTKYEDDGRRFMITVASSPTYRANLIFDYKGYQTPPNGWRYSKEKMDELDRLGYLYYPTDKSKQIYKKIYLDEYLGQPVTTLWTDISLLKGKNSEITGYPTQKPEQLLERIISISSNPGDIVFDCFMGSGTTQAVATKLGRRFIGADINLGAIQITTNRLLKIAKQIHKNETSNVQLNLNLDLAAEGPGLYEVDGESITNRYTGFEVYNVNHYDVFRNPLEARDILLQALEVQPLPAGSLFDGEKDGRLVKIMPVDRIATRADLNELITGFNYKEFEKRRDEHPNQPVESILLVCMGHEPELKAQLEMATGFKLDVEVVDILRDKTNLEFKRDSEARITRKKGKLIIERFYPSNLLQKLGLLQEEVDDWRELVESVMIDWDYDGASFKPSEVDIPGKNELVKGQYPVPDDIGIIRVKIIDLLSESLEVEV
ncbi:MAG: site-specific DNA-methyltransferase [Syntrophomonadaceae bacterium]|nr:site-specific DNA-methyltransferase [Syntrophomonadaceae bacterium]